MKRTKLKSISPRKAKANELYRKAKKEYRVALALSQGLDAKTDPLCERCLSRTCGAGIHHKAGRSGVLLWHGQLFAGLCDVCHIQEVHGHPSQARVDGWIVDLTRDQYEEIRQEEQPKLYGC